MDKFIAQRNVEINILLEIPHILPGNLDNQNVSLDRLVNTLNGQRGIIRAHLKPQNSPKNLCLHYDPNILSLVEVKRMAKQAGSKIHHRYRHARISIEDLDCSDCSLVIEHSLGRLPGVLAVKVDFVTQNMNIEYDQHKTDRMAIEKRIKSLGYTIPMSTLQKWYVKNRKLIFSLLSGMLLLVGWICQHFMDLPIPIPTGIFLVASLLAGWDITRGAWRNLRRHQLDTDLLMVVAAIGAAFLGNYAEGTLLLVLFSSGHALEERALDRARNAVRSLANLAPKTALVRRAGKESVLPVGQIILEDTVIVRPGTRLPVDGIILSGCSAIDQSAVTGEPLPEEKYPGEKVFTGTINGRGALEVRVTRLAKDSTLARVMKLVEEAQAQKSPTQLHTEWFAHFFVPVVLVADVLIMLIPPLFGFPFRQSFLRAMTLLVAASPCALALGTPAAVLAGIAQAARCGVLIKGSAHLENLGRIKVIAFDKTGTITHGKPVVSEIFDFRPKIENRKTPHYVEASQNKGRFAISNQQSEILQLAASIENLSAHPLAQGIIEAARERQIALLEMNEIESLTGRGLHAKLNGVEILAGNQKLIEEHHIDIPENSYLIITRLEAEGRTLLLIAYDKVLIGLIALTDTLRTETRTMVQALSKLGITQTLMLTGDNPQAAATIAHQAGFSGFHANLLPEEKQNVIRDLVKQYVYVAMLGDGVNDAPALASATVGIAMGGASTDVALETADVALMANDLSKLPFTIGLGRATTAIITQNLTIALVTILLLSATSLAGLTGIGLAIIVHEGSTILVVLNALRLFKYR